MRSEKAGLPRLSVITVWTLGLPWLRGGRRGMHHLLTFPDNMAEETSLEKTGCDVNSIAA